MDIGRVPEHTFAEVVMRTVLVSTGMVVWFQGVCLAAPAPDAAQAIVAQAIKAHGGEEVLARLRADKVRFKGQLILRGHAIPFTAETTVQLPSQYKTVIELNGEGGKHTIVHIVNGDKVFVTIDSEPKKLDPAALSEIRNALDLQRALRLVPLLMDRSYQLTALPEDKVNDRPAVGVLVTAKGRKDLKMYFDRELGLLVKTEHALEDGSGKQVQQMEFYGDFKDFRGHKRATRVKTFRDGKPVMEAELLDAKYFDRIDDSEFAKP
jgi:hypothetical protein